MPKRKPSARVYAAVAKRFKSRRTSRKRMSRSKRRRGGKYSKAISQHVYARYGAEAINANVTDLEYGKGEAFTFDGIKGYTEFSALYDRYRITCVQMELTLVNNPDSFLYTEGPVNNQNLTNWFPKFWYVKDYDDNTAPTLAQLRERSNVKNFVLRPNKTYKVKIRPAILNQTYRTVASTGYSPHWKQWIDMQNTDVPHYGFKWLIDTQGLNPNNDYPFKIRIEYKYFFTCKDVL